MGASDLETIDSLNVHERSWPDKVRDLYSEEVEARLYREHHFLFILGLVSCLVTIGLDALINPAMVKEGALLRVLLVGPITLLGMVAAQNGWTRILMLCIIAAPTAFAGLVIHLTFHLPPHFAASYLTGTTLIVGLANAVLPISMRWLVAFNLAFITTALTVLALGPEGTLLIRSDYIFLLCVVAGGTLPLAGRIEQLRRRNFLLNLRTKISAIELRDANLKLRDLSERDPLTGVLNRRGFARFFHNSIVKAHNDGNVIYPALIMIDIDHFKHFNDTHGHVAGDTCLTMVADALRKGMDPKGFVGRYGGEEFVISMCENYPGHARDFAEDVRKSIAALLVPIAGEHGASGRSLVTASLGVGIGASITDPVTPEDSEIIREELIEMADSALYSAKNSGRNRVEVIRRMDPCDLVD